jgi:hypothetical protein
LQVKCRILCCLTLPAVTQNTLNMVTSSFRTKVSTTNICMSSQNGYFVKGVNAVTASAKSIKTTMWMKNERAKKKKNMLQECCVRPACRAALCTTRPTLVSM